MKKNKQQNIILGNFSSSLGKISSGWKHFLSVLVIDFSFFIAAGYILSMLWMKALDHMIAVLGIMEKATADLNPNMTESASEEQLALIAGKSAEVLAHYKIVTYYVIAMLAVALALWCIFQGISWFMTHKITGSKKEGFWRFMLKFTVLSTAWWALLLLINSIIFRLNFASSGISLIGAGFFRALIVIITFIMFCIACTSYSLIPYSTLKTMVPETFSTLRKRFKSLAFAYVIFAVFLSIEYLIFINIVGINGIAAAAFGIMVMFPTIAWSRVYAIESAR